MIYYDTIVRYLVGINLCCDNILNSKILQKDLIKKSSNIKLQIYDMALLSKKSIFNILSLSYVDMHVQYSKRNDLWFGR